ncbi:hypothetical protein GCM10027403_26770 [Arthrobacter tecti]
MILSVLTPAGNQGVRQLKVIYPIRRVVFYGPGIAEHLQDAVRVFRSGLSQDQPRG